MANELMTTDPFEMTDAELADFLAKDAGRGNEMVTTRDIAIPMIAVLQSNSPQVNEDHDLYIDGAKAGMFLQTVDEEVYDGRNHGLDIIPVSYERVFNEWKPRDEGGGLIAIYSPEQAPLDQTKPNDKGIPTLPNGNNLVETAQHYVLYRRADAEPDEEWRSALVPMKSSFLKKSRRWNSLISRQIIPGTQKQAPRWLYVWNMKTVKEQKDENVWSNLQFERSRMVNKSEYIQASKLYEAYMEGRLQGDAGKTDADDGEMPF